MNAKSTPSDYFIEVPNGAAMTMNVSPSPGAAGRRPTKFTPQAIEKIKVLVAQGVSRDEIAKLLGVTVGSLQVTCSRLGISLRRIILQNGSAPLDARGRTTPAPSVGGSAPLQEQKKAEGGSQTAAHDAPLAKFALVIRYRGKEVATDIPLTSHDINALAVEAVSRDLRVAEIAGQILVAAIKKNMIQEILR